MHPVLMTGYHGLDDALLPADEYGERLKAVRAVMADGEIDGLVIYGDCDKAPLLTYLTNFFPRNRWAIGTFTGDEDPVLYVAGGTRDLPFAAMQTWMNRAEPYGAVGRELPAWHAGLSKKLDRPARIGTYGFAEMLAPVHHDMTSALANAGKLTALDDKIDAVLSAKRSREVAAIRQSCQLLDEASEALCTVFTDGGNADDALLEAERVARFRGAHDVRMLASFDGGRTFEPFLSPRGIAVPDSLVAYLAIRRNGYWGTGFITARRNEPSRAELSIADALAELIEGFRPNMTGDDIAALSPPGLAGYGPHPILGRVLCHGVGLSIKEGPLLERGSEAIALPGGVYALQLGIDDIREGAAIRSAIIHLRSDGGKDVLWH